MSFGIKEDGYARKQYKPEEIIAKLRQVDVLVDGEPCAYARVPFDADQCASFEIRPQVVANLGLIWAMR